MSRLWTYLSRVGGTVVSMSAVSFGGAVAGEGGSSNYIPGFYGDQALALAPPDGLSMRNDFFVLVGDASRTIDSGQIQASADVTAIYDYLTLLYKPSYEIFGTEFAIGLTTPLARAEVDASLAAGGGALRAGDVHGGFGDPTLAFYLYENWGKFHFASANFIVVPLGDYSANRLANTGLNYWTFETDLMATYLDEQTGQDYSIVVGYGYNTENDDTNYKTGDEFHVDFVFNQYLSEDFGVGVNGFYFRQLSGDSGTGAVLGDFKGEAVGVGPAVYWNPELFGKQLYLSAKWIRDVHTKNRFDNDYIYASFALTF